MTIHWKGLEEHFLIVFQFLGKNAFSEFFPKNLRPGDFPFGGNQADNATPG
jgi:hypothetical protein